MIGECRLCLIAKGMQQNLCQIMLPWKCPLFVVIVDAARRMTHRAVQGVMAAEGKQARTNAQNWLGFCCYI